MCQKMVCRQYTTDTVGAESWKGVDFRGDTYYCNVRALIVRG